MMRHPKRWLLIGLTAFLVGAAGAPTLAQSGPFSAQIQIALRSFLTQAHTWTGVQTFSGGIVGGNGTVPTGVVAGSVLASNGVGVQGVWSATPSVTSLTASGALSASVANSVTLSWESGNTGRLITFGPNNATNAPLAFLSARSDGSNQLGWIIGTSGGFYPNTDASFDLGGPSNRINAVYASGALIVGTNPATAGELRLPNNGAGISSRNTANNGNITLLYADNSNLIRLGDSATPSYATRLESTSVTLAGVGPHAIGGATSAGIQLYQTGSPTLSAGTIRGYAIDTTLTMGANNTATTHFIGGAFVEAGSGTHPLLASQYINIAVVTPGAATVTNTASLYVAGPMTATVTGVNYVEWIAAGTTVRWGGYGAGAATFDANGNITSVSDARYKEQVRSYTYGLDAVRQLRPVLYRWNEASKLDRDHDYAGFIAQEVEAALGPTSVGRDENGYLTLQDRAILAATVKAVQELYELVKK